MHWELDELIVPSNPSTHLQAVTFVLVGGDAELAVQEVQESVPMFDLYFPAAHELHFRFAELMVPVYPGLHRQRLGVDAPVV